ncbi:hypothetical protein PPL_07376 [Heterostelium album PN500]|uniref:Chitinase n=1 Tax=Heterostelium pallidum (strain ATCC 26659 / Pp 5 / PN500) TaxID=670386 RepID=D3BFS5_HETP5|nr:hypothetical protein PPL_07376 [Heterostelium album PN500]EFA79685.1 hypothetical protein PPL_07376 [Heterostelium album PN500]|eukprot:XP_020431806.1 hypothetical protein PPL_07376 [Heterostelium album PN500]
MRIKHLLPITYSCSLTKRFDSLDKEKINAICDKKTVESGDSCWSLARKCGVQLNTFYSYNPSLPDGCQFLQVGQQVCCGEGGLSPTVSTDGSCSVYKVVPGDFCYAIAMANGLKVDDIESFNKNTWGWKGCSKIEPDALICLSSGTPPIPTVNPKAECGPVAPIIPTRPFNSTCRVGACCSQWGYCGLTAEFCTVTNSDTNAPGTTGCISNCGMEFIKSEPPTNFISIGYYEAWNSGRPCLNAQIDRIDISNYTHIHFAFATITSDFGVSVSAYPDSFTRFKHLPRVKKILSFGGWSFSTDVDTRPIFRNTLSFINRATFIGNLISFIEENRLDGVDFDWEYIYLITNKRYPGAEDLGGDPTDGLTYLQFIRDLRESLPRSKSLSIAAPASYWYLRGFLIKEMEQYLDYIVYMTYDIHGQWDYNINSTGPYLRSHIDLPEVLNALILLTKAGVPSNKIIMGLGSYGRSFQQVDPSCSGPTCQFTGPESGATGGKCTQQPGYLALAEINDIVVRNTNVRDHFYDEQSDSQILLFNTHDWVAYATPSITANRINIAKSMNLGGTVEWAIDLNREYSGNVLATACDFSTVTGDLNSVFKQQVSCQMQSSIYSLRLMLHNAIETYEQAMEHYNEIFELYERSDPGAMNPSQAIEEFLYKARLLEKNLEESILDENPNQVINGSMVLVTSLTHSAQIMSNLAKQISSGQSISEPDIVLDFINANLFIIPAFPGIPAMIYLVKNWPSSKQPFNTDSIKFFNWLNNNIDTRAPLLILPPTGDPRMIAPIAAITDFSNGGLFEREAPEPVDDPDNPDNQCRDQIVSARGFEVVSKVSCDLLGPCLARNIFKPLIVRGIDCTLAIEMCNKRQHSDGDHNDNPSDTKRPTREEDNPMTGNSNPTQPTTHLPFPGFDASFLMRPSNPLIPTYYVNINGQSPGVACNTAMYMTAHRVNVFHYAGEGNQNPKPRRCSPGGATYPYELCSRVENNIRWERDEFPLNSMIEGYDNVTGTVNVQVKCVAKPDNSREGASVSKFYNGGKPSLTRDSLIGQNDWRPLDPVNSPYNENRTDNLRTPLNPISGNGRKLVRGDPFNVVIYQLPPVCDSSVIVDAVRIA